MSAFGNRTDMMRHTVLFGTIILLYFVTGRSEPSTDCGGTFKTLDKYFISSPSYPSFYPANTTCVYNIVGPVAGFGIRLEFKNFSIEESNGCQIDSLKIYDGPRISSANLSNTRCGRDRRDFFSKTKNLILVFRADSTGNFTGFKIQVER
eukprot:gene5911-6598_t